MNRIIAAKTDDRITDIERRNRELARKAATEGIVLLENDGTLPLKPCKIALYGIGAKNTIKGGTGSGEVNVRHSVSIYEGLKDAGFTILSERSLKKCDTVLEEARRKHEEEAKSRYSIADAFAIVFTIPEDNAVSEDELCDCDTAIYVLARQSGEGKDRRIEGNFKLNPNEISSLKLLRKHYKRVILVINAGSSLDLSDVEDLGLNAVIFFCQEGEEGGNALADLLTGKENFSGKLTDTWVKSYADVPFGNEFSYLNGDIDREYYREGIYVGYRYYDSFSVPVRYHFGYGLSYTSFDIKTEDVSVNKDEITLKIKVTNTGEYPGKEVIQIYVSCPEGRLDKEFQRLVSFKKTALLKPSESETLSLSFKMNYCASFDEENDSFILEKGNYIIRTGNSSDNAEAAAYISNKKDIILSRHKDILGNGNAFKDLKSPPHGHDADGLKKLVLDPSAFKTETYEYKGLTPIHDERVERIISSMTKEEKILAVTGEERENRRPLTDYVFTPGSVARTTQKLIDRGVINTNLADGPAGLRLLNKSFLGKDGEIRYLKGNFPIEAMELFIPSFNPSESDEILYQYPTAWPVETALAQTFNTELLEEIGKAVSEEMSAYNITYWLSPGMNIHRNPLCGRNFEYYSEDPLLTAKMAISLLKGIASIPGNYTTIKHFACNNAEDRRSFSDSIVSKRALREIYLKAFELTVKEGEVTGVMTSYNKLNGIYTSDNYELAVSLLRNEWGYKGVLMTDWMSTFEGFGDNVKAVKAGHVMMPGGPFYHVKISEGLKKGTLKEEDLDTVLSYILKAILDSDVSSRIKTEDII